jgi:hypothetical protein
MLMKALSFQAWEWLINKLELPSLKVLICKVLYPPADPLGANSVGTIMRAIRATAMILARAFIGNFSIYYRYPEYRDLCNLF